MTLKEQLTDDLKAALFAKEELKVSTLRLLLADMKNYQIEKQRELEDSDVVNLVERQVKKHRESIESFAKGNRPDMVAKEKAELEILQKYLPEQISEEEILTEIGKAITDTGATSITEMGKVMTALAHLKGKADFSFVSQKVKERLN